MEVRRSIRQVSALLAFPLLFSIAVPAFDHLPEHQGNLNSQVLLAGKIGKSSSASAKVTLIIPGKTPPKSETGSETVEQQQATTTEQNTGDEPNS